MRRIFSGYYRPSDEEFSDLWRDCLFVLDANVLLNLYRYSKDTNEDLIRVLSVVSERLWLPHQVALEYQDNRLDIISGQEIVYQEIPRILEDAQKKIRGLFRQEHLSIDVDSMLKTVESAFEVIRRELNKHRSRHPDLFRNDHIRDTITSLFEGKVGLPYSQDEVDKLSRKGESRYQNQVPPGYKDLKDKQGRTKRYGSTVVKEEYGDLILWSQLLDKAKSVGRPIIFISDDKKEDWWWRAKGKTIGTRPELVAEMLDESGVLFYMYQTDQFISYARDYLDIQIPQETVNEVQEVAVEYRMLAELSDVDDYERAIESWNDSLGRHDVYAPPVRRLLVQAYLVGHGNRWNAVPPEEIERIVNLLEDNLREEPTSDLDWRMWIQAIRYSSRQSIDMALEKLARWKAFGDSQDATYYLYVLHALKAIKGTTVDKIRVTSLLQELQERSRYRRDRTRSLEWFGEGYELRSLVHYSELGEWNEEKGFFDDPSGLVQVEGRIAAINGPERGTIEVLPSGLSAFFVPAVASMGDGQFETLKPKSDLRVSFYLGFCYDGLRAWQVEKIQP